jgi:adenylylsulfate kinase
MGGIGHRPSCIVSDSAEAELVHYHVFVKETLAVMSNRGFTLWFTGLSGAGKSTLAQLVGPKLAERGCKVEVLDGDVVRTNLSKGLGFSKEDRDTNIRRIGFVAHLLSRNGVAVITAAISPYREIRRECRDLIGNFVEVYVKASVDACAARDVKGLYKKAFAGEIKEFTGVSDPYEEPLAAEIVVDTENETPEQCAAKILAKLEELGYLAAVAAVAATESDDEDELIRQRLEELGYV